MEPTPDETPRLTERQAIARDLRAFDELDRSQAGSLTGRSYGKVRRYDSNQDGKVTREEFLAGRALERARARFRELDRDGDGRIGAHELKERHRHYDLNQDGVVDEAEFLDKRLAETAPMRDEAEFDRIDRSHDGFLTGQRSVKKWRRYDANGDGRISKEEFMFGRAKDRVLGRMKALVDEAIARAAKPPDPS